MDDAPAKVPTDKMKIRVTRIVCLLSEIDAARL
jgi:hypothetical protein